MTNTLNTLGTSLPALSKASQDQLNTCVEPLQKVVQLAITVTDFTVLEGHRGQAAQEAAVKAGNSQLHYPHGNHNATPSKAVDLAPYPVQWPSDKMSTPEDWHRRERFVFLAGVMFACAAAVGVKLRWGGDFNRNRNFTDDNFCDLPHFEIDS